MPRSKNVILVCALLSICLIALVAQKINLTNVDLGRHLINGVIMLDPSTYGATREALLHTNFFSYTFPDYPFINHHWGSGVLMYLIYLTTGFTGLSVVYVLCILGAFLALFFISLKYTSLSPAILGSLLSIPLIAERTEVRPEGVSYLFIAIFIYILWQVNKKHDYKKLYFLPIIALFWANMHIYFILGPLIIGAFIFESLVRKEWELLKKLSYTFAATIIATLVTPYGWSGLVYPFVIFKNYGYLVAENQSIPFLLKLGFSNPNFLLWFIVIAIILVTSIMILIYRRKDFAIALSCIAIAFGILGFFGIRYLAIFGISMLPLLIWNIHILSDEYREKFNADKRKTFYTATVIIIIIMFTLIYFSARMPWNSNFGIGLMKDVNGSAEFVKENKISGPFFTNYDIGSYFIFHMFTPDKLERVFVDNRPEAYPKEFFQNVYVKMQEDDNTWQQQLKKNNFNVIWFYRHDYTPWGQKFLITRVKDKAWAPVFVDNYTIIFLKRSDINTSIIKKYELPKSMFNVQ